MELKGKVALVTGGGRGIGQGIALALAGAGADVAVADLDQTIAEETAAKVEAAGRRSVAISVNVAQPDSVRAMVEKVEAELGGLDIAVNNAGIISIQSIEELTAEDFDRIMAVNAKGVFLCTQAAVRVMRPRRWGRIVNVASIAGKIGFPDLSHYTASKFAVIGFTNAVAKEVALDGITVNALCPGIVGTGMWRGEDGLAGRWREEGESEEASWARHQKTLLPQGVAQTPEDMGQLAVYLACAEHVTGQAIAVDGGCTL
ncbi:SDR family NAD(P)-dependent oxidoreductase [Alcanivorax sp. EA2]|jgi:meso-butanediol dehydrogenase / (S,S)-butanediol dehydrogenase / diacetyl reductase|uniref:SDR family NAD(P)-dependent oxidoreductase n=1 Tax=Alloalcanivorax xenomutans TaxID=1094342 RepID=UPI000E224F36